MWILPSLNRIDRVRALLVQMVATGLSTPGLVLLGAREDPGTLVEVLPPGWQIELDHPLTPCSLVYRLNRSFALVPDRDWYGLIADDNWPVTPGWDVKLIEAATRTGIASCDDGWQAPRRMHSAVVWRGDILRAAGFWVPPCMRHNYIDDFWETIGRRFGFWTCLPDVRVEHRHWKRDATVSKDTTYERGEATLMADYHAFVAWTKTEDHSAIVERFSAIKLAANPAQGDRLTRARSRSVFIATPMARHPVRQYTASLVKTIGLLGGLGIRSYVQTVVGSSNLPRARNELVAAFLASDFTDMIFIDDDMGWDPKDLVRLLASDKPVIGGVGVKKVERPDTDPGRWCFFPLQGDLNQDAMGAIEVKGVGTGFLKIERRVFEELALHHPDWKRNGWPNMPEAARRWYYRFFMFPDDIDETGEDFFFCNAWREIGGSVWIDPTIRLEHVGEKSFSGDLAALMEAEGTRHDANLNDEPRHAAVAGEP
nr:hypothetical protein [uncultured Rhodopila sp.]